MYKEVTNSFVSSFLSVASYTQIRYHRGLVNTIEYFAKSLNPFLFLTITHPRADADIYQFTV